MKATKLEITRNEIEIATQTARLLSKREYLNNKDNITPLSVYWWLSDKGATHANALVVTPEETIMNEAVNNPYVYVRPVIVLPYRRKTFAGGDKFEFAGLTWTMLRSTGALLCDTFVGEMPFKNDWRVFDANYYPKSDVSKWVINWAVDNGILDKEGKADDRR